MKYDRREPCTTCPYRKDVAPGIWHPSEYEKLRRADRDELNGGTFLCHLSSARPKSDAEFCAGWLVDQKRRGVPSIHARKAELRARAEAEAANPGPWGPPTTMLELLSALDAAERCAEAAQRTTEAAWAALGVTKEDREACDDPDVKELCDSIRVTVEYEQVRVEQAQDAAKAETKRADAAERLCVALADAMLDGSIDTSTLIAAREQVEAMRGRM